MRAVFSAMRRSLASTATVLASSRRGARKVKPLGLEDGHTALAFRLLSVTLRRVSWHGLLVSKCEEGEPVTRLPLSEPYEPRRFD